MRRALFPLLALALASLLALPALGAAFSPKKAVYKGRTSAKLAVTLKTYRHGTRLGYRVHNRSTCVFGPLDGQVRDVYTRDGGRPGRRAKVHRRTGKFNLQYEYEPSHSDSFVQVSIRGRVTRNGARGTFSRHEENTPVEFFSSQCDTGDLRFNAKRTK